MQTAETPVLPKRSERFRNVLREARRNYDCYLFLLPFGLLFILFTVVPVVMSMGLSFTYYNVLQPPKFIGLLNYKNLFINDDVFLIAVKNTFIIAIITGPVGYFASLMIAWFLNELPHYLRALMVTIMYAPAISGGAFVIWKIIFFGDSYGYVNGLLLNLGLIDAPIKFMTDTRWMLSVCIVAMIWMSLGAGFLSLVAGLRTVDTTMYEAGYVEGIRNRWQELWYITLPCMKPQLMFSAVMSITASFAAGDVTTALFGFPSTQYAAHTIINHLQDYGNIRFEMGYACAIATLLFLVMVGCNELIQKLLNRVGQ